MIDNRVKNAITYVDQEQMTQVLINLIKNSIEGYLRMMQERQAGEQIASYDEMIDRAIARIKGMRVLIMDLLDLTKIESGKKNREMQQTDLVKIARISSETMGSIFRVILPVII